MGQTDNLPPSLTSPFEELIAASIRDCRRYRSALRFVREREVTDTRCHCLRTTIPFFVAEYGISEQGCTRALIPLVSKEKRVSTWLVQARWSRAFVGASNVTRGCARSLILKYKATGGQVDVLTKVSLLVGHLLRLSILIVSRFGLVCKCVRKTKSCQSHAKPSPR